MDCCTSVISPLYRISSHSGSLPHNEQLLKSVQTYIAGSAKRGKRLWCAIYDCGFNGVKEKELLELIEETQEPDILLEYSSVQRICAEDVWDIWPYDAANTRAEIKRIYDDEMIIA